MTPLPTAPYLALKAVMMPRDTNHLGTIFGGVLLSYIDQAGAVGARYEIERADWPPRKLVTVAMNAVEFHEAVLVGDVVSFWTRVNRLGTTSISMHVSVETERMRQVVRLTEAEVVYVAIDAESGDRRPRPIRPLDATDV
jgi:acyl-CoA thioesterase YciA